jgi:hypothetical protein
MKDLARMARKDSLLYQELRRDIGKLLAEQRPKKREKG